MLGEYDRELGSIETSLKQLREGQNEFKSSFDSLTSEIRAFAKDSSSDRQQLHSDVTAVSTKLGEHIDEHEKKVNRIYVTAGLLATFITVGIGLIEFFVNYVWVK